MQCQPQGLWNSDSLPVARVRNPGGIQSSRRSQSQDAIEANVGGLGMMPCLKKRSLGLAGLCAQIAIVVMYSLGIVKVEMQRDVGNVALLLSPTSTQSGRKDDLIQTLQASYHITFNPRARI